MQTQKSLSELAPAAATHQMIGIRAGRVGHAYLSIWAVVVEGRVFVRSWGLQKGWYNTFLTDSVGAVKIGTH